MSVISKGNIAAAFANPFSLAIFFDDMPKAIARHIIIAHPRYPPGSEPVYRRHARAARHPNSNVMMKSHVDDACDEARSANGLSWMTSQTMRRPMVRYPLIQRILANDVADISCNTRTRYLVWRSIRAGTAWWVSLLVDVLPAFMI